MSTISSVSVDFIANVAKFSEGLRKMKKDVGAFTAGLDKDIANASKTLAKIGTAATAAGTALYAGLAAGVAKSINHISNLKDEADKVGASASGFMLLGAAAEQAGASADDVKRAMVEITKSINEAREGTDATSTAFQSLGIDFQKLSSLTSDQQFIAVAEALNRVQDRTEKARLGTLLLGKSYNELAVTISDISNVELPVGAVLSDQQIKNIKAAGEGFERLKVAIGGVFNLIAAGFSVQLTNSFDDLGRKIKEFMADSRKVTDALSLIAAPVLTIISLFDSLRAGIKVSAVG